jgi:hypothetical protein
MDEHPQPLHMRIACAAAAGNKEQRRPSSMTTARPTLLIFGKTISGTEARIGRSRLPKPLTVAGMTKKKIINMAWARCAYFQVTIGCGLSGCGS